MCVTNSQYEITNLTLNPPEHNLPAREENALEKQYFGTRQKLFVAYRPPFYTRE